MIFNLKFVQALGKMCDKKTLQEGKSDSNNRHNRFEPWVTFGERKFFVRILLNNFTTVVFHRADTSH